MSNNQRRDRTIEPRATAVEPSPNPPESKWRSRRVWIFVIAVCIVSIVTIIWYIRHNVLRTRRRAHSPLVILPNTFGPTTTPTSTPHPFWVDIAQADTQDDLARYLDKNEVGEMVATSAQSQNADMPQWLIRHTPHGGWRMCGLDLCQLKVGDLLLSTDIFLDEEKALLHNLLYNVFGDECRTHIDQMAQPWVRAAQYGPIRRQLIAARRQIHFRHWIRNIVTGDVPAHTAVVGQRRGDGTQPEDFTIYDFTAPTGKCQMLLADYLQKVPSTKSRLWVVHLSQRSSPPPSSKKPNTKSNAATTNTTIKNEQASRSFATLGVEAGVRAFQRYGQARFDGASGDELRRHNREWHGLYTTHLSCATMAYALLESWSYVSHRDPPTSPSVDQIPIAGIQKRRLHPAALLPSDFMRRDFQWADNVSVTCVRRVLWIRKGNGIGEKSLT